MSETIGVEAACISKLQHAAFSRQAGVLTVIHCEHSIVVEGDSVHYGL